MKRSSALPVGSPLRRVLVEAVDFDRQLATVLMPSVDTRMNIPLGVTRVRSETPKVGETWIIERTLGSQWVFAALVRSSVPPPVVTGSRAASDDVALSLLDALVALGLVEDGTDP